MTELTFVRGPKVRKIISLSRMMTLPLIAKAMRMVALRESLRMSMRGSSLGSKMTMVSKDQGRQNSNNLCAMTAKMTMTTTMTTPRWFKRNQPRSAAADSTSKAAATRRVSGATTRSSMVTTARPAAGKGKSKIDIQGLCHMGTTVLTIRYLRRTCSMCYL